MEVVRLAHITFNRIGSASGGGGFRSQRQVKFSAEMTEADQSTLRQLVIAIAEANGEAAGALENLNYERSYAGKFVFNIQGSNTFYSTAYAECHIIHALKANGCYFKLEAIDDRDITPFAFSEKAN
ncbi:hypothetical protein [Pseudomonas sp. Au-Pse12]|uniref:hypothetical protein n=1 Tax=Pseudomonas sp. Au-Pse12 TaxID=2906459 RepID=UPI001E6599CB|nr:hypothetical protein [Pseudomonas sp. Au-Pse12]MCE4052873.1 hypothetical protein [Pseudomonas sp. Au-Pse12]